jgi:hypothetical protein
MMRIKGKSQPFDGLRALNLWKGLSMEPALRCPLSKAEPGAAERAKLIEN